MKTGNDCQVKIKHFNELNIDELYKILKLRSDVFIVEQKCAYDDIDGLDPNCIHVYIENQHQEILACARVFYHDENNHIAQIGRLATIERKIGLGKLVLQSSIKTAIENLKAQQILIEAQSYAIGFYNKEGFEVISDEFIVDGIPHVKMMYLVQ